MPLAERPVHADQVEDVRRELSKAQGELEELRQRLKDVKLHKDAWQDLCQDAVAVLGYRDGESVVDAAKRVVDELEEFRLALSDRSTRIHQMQFLQDENAESIRALQARLDSLEKIHDVADHLRQARDERLARTAALQAVASAARKGGPSGPDAIAKVDREHPIVWDLGNIVDDMCEALEKHDKFVAKADKKQAKKARRKR